MRLFNDSLERIRKGGIRKEDDLTTMIDEFFSRQPNVARYEIKDKENWVVDVEGSVDLYEDDLTDGNLFFKLGVLTGNLYCHVKNFRPSVIPTKHYGEIVFVPDEEEQWKNRQASDKTSDDSLGGMEMITSTPTRAQVINKLEKVFTDYIAGDYDVNFDEIIERLKNEWDNRDRYELVVKAERRPNTKVVDCDIKILGGKDDSPLKLLVVEKAMYLAFMLQEKGIGLDYTTPLFWNTARKIYYQLAGDKVMNETNGLASNEVMKTTTINGYRSNIRSEIKKRISNDRIVDEFAVEGYKDKPVFVKRATPEIREHIKEVFEL